VLMSYHEIHYHHYNVSLCYQDADASYDVNGRDSDPQPRYDSSDENRSDLLSESVA